MSIEAAILEIQELRQENSYLKNELANLKKLIFGSKKETFKSIDNPNQLSLFEHQELETIIPVVEEKHKITYERKVSTKHKGRNDIPDHLPVEEVIIEPTEDIEGMVKIGEEITLTLKYTKASLIQIKTIRPKYAKAEGSGVVIAELPSRPIDKGIAEASLLSHIIVSKFIDHLPFYRQIQMFKRDYNWDLSSSTVNDWFVACCTLLDPLYQILEKKVKQSKYLQGDESPIKVLDKEKEGSSHQGYQWVFHSIEEKIVLMKYSRGRGEINIRDFLIDYEGILQCDGYAVYTKIASMNPLMKLAACLAHIRRKFIEAQINDAPRSKHVLALIQTIYAHEAKTKNLTALERKNYRHEHVTPLLEEIKNYIDEQAYKVAPKSLIGKAISYAQNQWSKLELILQHGEVEIDNNLVENKIRPLALGRKNFLFAGSHDGAQRIAMMYSFFGSCKSNGINPFSWLEETLSVIKDTKLSDLENLLPRAKILEV